VSNYDEWEVIPMVIGVAVLLVIFGVLYIAIVSIVSYLFIAGIAYTAGQTLPDFVPYLIVGTATVNAIWKFYKEVKS